MKKLLLHTIAFLIPVGVFIIGVEWFLGQETVVNSSRKKKFFLEQNLTEIEGVVLGSSQVLQGVNPKYSASQNIYNLANVSQSLYLDAELIKMYAPKLEKLKTVYWGISYPTLFLKLSKSQEAWRENLYTLEYGIPANRNQNIVEKHSYFRTYGLETSTKIFKNKGNLDLASSINERGFQTVKVTETPRNNALERIGYHHQDMKMEFLKENLSFIEKTLTILKEKNVEVIFFTTPTSSSYYNLEQAGYLKLKNKTIADLNKRYGSTYLNFERLKAFDQNPKYFLDADHMNVLGAEIFSEMLFKDSLRR